ncbi:MAG: ABC transporter substrate-binding protein [Chloroflexi bacterium]|nr:ABC transporter substrate-binding protein [Chloroflexota bacterium]
MFRGLRIAFVLIAVFAFVLAACGETSDAPSEVVRTVEVERQVTVEVEKLVTVEVEKPVVQEVVRVVEVEKPVEVVRQVTVEVMQEAQMLPPLVIGHLNALTGSLSYFGVSHGNAADLAASHINRAGGIQGGSVVIINRDTGVNPVQGVDAARALVDVESVAAIVGALASGVTIPVATSVTAPNKTLQISHSSTAPSITALEDDDFLFRTTVSDAAQGVVLGRLAWEQGYKSAGIMYINNAYGQGLAERFTQTFTELGGTVTASVPHEDSQPTFTSELEKATEGNPDVLVTVSYPGQAEIYLREALEGDYADTFLFVDGVKSDDMVQAIGGGKLDGTLGTAPGAPDSPDRQAFYNAYTLTFGVEAPQEPYLAETYDAVVLIALAAAKAGTTTDSVAIRDALRDVANPPGEVVGPGLAGIQKALSLIASGQDINYEGASGPVDFDENGDVAGPIEVWTVEGDAVKSTGRFELP